MVEAHTKGITMFLAFMLTICSVSVICGVASTASPSCPKDEYRVGIECCPACPAGKQVSKDCEERSMTKCKNCSDGTFQKGPNVKKQCSNCTKCDAGLGLKVKKSCSSTSDAVCEVLDGFFCSDSNGGGCRVVQRHTVCSPGQYIGQRGTADKDTECLPCANGTFSNGTSSCQPHTICESKELKLMKPGTDSTDSECGEHGSERHVAGIISGVILLILALIIVAITLKKIALLYGRLSKKKGIAETDYNLVTTPLMSTDGPEPTRDQQEHTITTPDGTMDDQEDDQSPGPAPPSSPTHNGSVSVSVHQEDDKPVHTKRDSGASEASLLSPGPPSPSKSSFLSPMRSSTSRSIQWSLPPSLGPPSTSRSARRFLVRSKSVSSCLEAVSQVKPLTLSARRFRSKSESSHFNNPRPRRRASLLKGNYVAEEVLPVLENLDQPKSESDDSNSN